MEYAKTRSGSLVSIQVAKINRVDVEDRLICEKGSHEPNATLVWTTNVGVIGINSVGDRAFRTLAIEEFEAALKELFKKDVKITIAD